MKVLIPILLGLLVLGCGKKEPVTEVKPLEEKQQEVKEEAKPEEPVAETKPPEVVSVSLNLKHEIKGDTVTITGCNKKASGALTIPATIEGKAVTSIGKSAFSDCYSLTSITIPDGVTSIGKYAFHTCPSLTSIKIPDSVTSIGMRSFLSCRKLTTIEVGAGNVNYTDVNGTLFNSEKTVLLAYPAGKKGANYNIPNIVQHGPSASAVILVEGESEQVSFGNLNEALAQPDTQLRLFGKPQVKGKRRMGVAIARGGSIDEARQKAKTAAVAVEVKL
jgi:hypothetical protein